MRLKFKPNVAAPRGTSASGEAVKGGESGAGKRRSGQREKRLSEGDEGRATGGESSSEVETTGETNSTTKTRSRRRRVSSSMTTTTPTANQEQPSQSSDPQDKEPDADVINPPATTTTVSSSSAASSDSVSKDSTSKNSTSNKKPTIDNNPPQVTHFVNVCIDIIQPMGSSAAPMATVSLVRKPSASTASGSSQKNKPKIRKKVAPKVVSGRPRRTVVPNPLQSSTSNEPAGVNSQISGTAVTPQNRTSRLSKEQSSDEAISITLNEVLRNSHSHPLAETGLSGIVHPQLNLFASDNTIPELQTDIERSSSIAVEVGSSSGTGGGRTSRAGSESGQSRNSRSRTPNSICSEVDGIEGNSGGGRGQKTVGKRGKKQRAGTKRKKPSRDSTPCVEGDGQTTDSASSTPTKRARLSAAKVREAPNRTTMTMQELIYYNPTANPMSSTAEEKKRRKAEGEESRQAGTREGSRASSMQPPLETPPGESRATGGNGNEDSDRIVPQLRIGEDGQIIVDESSMLVETTDQRPLEEVSDVTMFTKHTTSASYRHRYRVTKWSKEETGRFFKALSQVGTDFTMMTLLLPRRSRKELKNKFKKEEKSSPHLISQALKNQYSLQKLKEKK